MNGRLDTYKLSWCDEAGDSDLGQPKNQTYRYNEFNLKTTKISSSLSQVLSHGSRGWGKRALEAGAVTRHA